MPVIGRKGTAKGAPAWGKDVRTGLSCMREHEWKWLYVALFIFSYFEK